MKTADDFVNPAPRCRFCKHSRHTPVSYPEVLAYYCDVEQECPDKTQEDWDKQRDEDYDSKSELSEWLGFYGEEDPDPAASPRFVGFAGEGICNKFERKEN